ncbi:hypothetical protein AAIR29_04665 [Psychrobacter sp. FBL11]|uniref:Uncharacterized protein n=1 Tax=Psychrobacter saeujeotis TaxID=3143436 RepID=A0ABU9X698_9GAMM|nr:hypothetical protein [uncultured Psychrobacter sp.]
MRDYKLLLAGLVLLLLAIFIGVFAWLWNSNRRSIDPLPIMASTKSDTSADEDDSVTTRTLYVQAEDKLQVPLDDVIVRFESRYPKLQVLARYVETDELLDLPDLQASNNPTTPDNNAINKNSRYIVNTDIIMANDKITKDRLAPLQASLKALQAEHNKTADIINNSIDNDEHENADTPNDNKEARNLSSFSYALKNTETVDGVILTENPAATSFRNFILSSVGQDILKQYDYENIEGYRNNLNDLFNPTSRAKPTADESSVQVADALSNGA